MDAEGQVQNRKRLKGFICVAATLLTLAITSLDSFPETAATGEEDKSLLLYEQRGSIPTGDAILPMGNQLVAFPHRKVSAAEEVQDYDDDAFLSEPADIPVDPNSEVSREIEEADRLATRPDVFDDDYVPRSSSFAVKVNNTWNDTETMCVLARVHCGWSADPEAAGTAASLDAVSVLAALLGPNAAAAAAAAAVAVTAAAANSGGVAAPKDAAAATTESGGSGGGGGNFQNATTRNATEAAAAVAAAEAICAVARRRCEVSTTLMPVPPPTPPPPAPDTWDDGPSLYKPRVATVGWDKANWTPGEWASWLLTGPIVSLAFVSFVFYCFGPAYGALAFAVCVAVDAATLYWNW